MPPLSRKRAPRLLHTVGGKRHATDADHEPDPPNTSTPGMDDEDVFADPVSSSDEALPTTQTSEVKTSSQTTPPASSQRRSSGKRKRGTPVPPPAGAYAKGKTEKNKENLGPQGKSSWSSSVPTKKGESGKKVEEEREPIGDMWNNFGMSGSSKKFNKKARLPPAHPNIHGNSYAGGRRPTIPKAYGVKVKTFSLKRENDEESDISDVSLEELESTTSSQGKHSKEARSSGKDSDFAKQKKGKRKKDRSNISSRSQDNLRKTTLKKTTSPIKSQPSLAEQFAAYGVDIHRRESSQPSDSNRKSLNLDPYASNTSSPLSSIPTSALESLMGDEDISEINDLGDDPETRCSVCKEPVDENELWEFSQTCKRPKRLTLREKNRFCKEHQAKKAHQQYKERGFPEIDWNSIEKRIKKHYPHLKAVLTNTASSHYRALQEQRATSGEDRSLFHAVGKESFNELVAGYYGLRGTSVFMESLTSAFAPHLRNLAITDPVVAFGGVSNFIQRVMVPELTTRLIMEDMAVNEEKAREILESSTSIGELVHEEVEDEIRPGAESAFFKPGIDDVRDREGEQ